MTEVDIHGRQLKDGVPVGNGGSTSTGEENEGMVYGRGKQGAVPLHHRFSIDVVSIDIEGYEVGVLQDFLHFKKSILF